MINYKLCYYFIISYFIIMGIMVEKKKGNETIDNLTLYTLMILTDSLIFLQSDNFEGIWGNGNRDPRDDMKTPFNSDLAFINPTDDQIYTWANTC